MRRKAATIPSGKAGARRCLVLAALALCMSASAAAVTIERMQVERADTRYTITADMRLAVAQRQAFRAASDYERLPEFNPSIIESKRLPGDRLRSTIRLCVALICKQIEQVMHYQQTPPDAISMQVVPGAGDLKSGHADWRFSSEDSGATRLVFEAEIDPDFWVPPLVGPYLIARELRRQARVTGQSIERLASDYDNDRPDRD
ncbi:cyclase/dehydrase [Salinisphaera sp. T5B8]|uniref:SRPBCC family protein n=1 Tax=Salinisphaera sp. T5B8 TaxID=1304154 RepID=UPI003340BBD9